MSSQNCTDRGVIDLSETSRSDFFDLSNGFLLVWQRRVWIGRMVAAGTLMFAILAFLIPKKYASTAQLMPPDAQGAGGTALLSALGGGSGLASLAGGVLDVKSTGDLAVGVLQSRTVSDRLIDKFDLRRVYNVATYEAARRKLSDCSQISLDNKSGIVSVRVLDPDPSRAQALANEYVTQLNQLMAEVSTSSARRERIFLEGRIKDVKQALDDSSRRLAEYSSKNGTLDLKEQGRAMIESAARLQGELISAESQLSGLRQIYGEENSRVKQSQALVGKLRSELARVGGTSDADYAADGKNESLYPPIRRLPMVGVTWLDLYRETTIQEQIYESLTKQFEVARVQEVKEIPAIKILDSADYPEKKASPPRTAIVLIGTLLSLCFACVYVLALNWWDELPSNSALKTMAATVRHDLPWQHRLTREQASTRR